MKMSAGYSGMGSQFSKIVTRPAGYEEKQPQRFSDGRLIDNYFVQSTFE